jgi:hypothetical protein
MYGEEEEEEEEEEVISSGLVRRNDCCIYSLVHKSIVHACCQEHGCQMNLNCPSLWNILLFIVGPSSLEDIKKPNMDLRAGLLAKTSTFLFVHQTYKTTVVMQSVSQCWYERRIPMLHECCSYVQGNDLHYPALPKNI